MSKFQDKINDTISNWSDMNRIRKFYRNFNKKFNPDYVNLMDRVSEYETLQIISKIYD